MSSKEWRLLRQGDPPALSQARLQAHYALQFLAGAARAYIKPEPDDSHTSLAWNGKIGGFATHAFTSGGRLALAIAELTLIYEAPDGESHSIPLHGLSVDAARRALAVRLRSAGIDPTGLDSPSPYEMPDHGLARGEAFDATIFAGALQALALWFDRADEFLAGAVARLRAHNLPAPQPRLWPHHFDLATLSSFPIASGATAYVGAGFSPGDHYYDEPYFYVSIYPQRDVASLPPLPSIGHWRAKDFLAAVATAHMMLAQTELPGEIDGFLREAIEAAIAAARSQ